MASRRLDVSKSSPDKDVVTNRRAFDAHLDDCQSCSVSGALCSKANTLWRGVVFAAMRAHGGK